MGLYMGKVYGYTLKKYYHICLDSAYEVSFDEKWSILFSVIKVTLYMQLSNHSHKNDMAELKIDSFVLEIEILSLKSGISQVMFYSCFIS